MEWVITIVVVAFVLSHFVAQQPERLGIADQGVFQEGCRRTTALFQRLHPEFRELNSEHRSEEDWDPLEEEFRAFELEIQQRDRNQLD
jgi:hypothetical protein